MRLLLAEVVGNAVKLTVDATDPATNTPADGTLDVVVEKADGTAVTPTITETSTGTWTVRWLPDAAGDYFVRAVLSGSFNAAAEGRVMVTASELPV